MLDPRVSEQAEVADLRLRLRAGTDAAMCLGWLKVIFDKSSTASLRPRLVHRFR